MSQYSNDIAIIGMSCIYPGAPDLKTYWQNVLFKVDAVSDPPDNWRAEFFFDPESTENDRIYCKKGGFIEEFAEFNPLEFGIMPGAVEGGSPEPFIALRLVKEAIGDAGYFERPFDRKRTGVVIGKGISFEPGAVLCAQHGIVVDQTLRVLKQLHPETSDAELQSIKGELKASLPPFNSDNCAWLVSNLVSAIVSNRLDFQGPNFTVDAACASSLIALNIGIRELLNNTCDMVIVGGCNVISSPLNFTLFSQLGALSRRGKIRPFDKDADGTLLGAGAGMIVIKRREDAERDGDRIYAVIKGVGVASDGRALGILVPRLEGELLAMQRAYDACGISPATITLIEAHGTGTTVGDLTEIQAMSQIFGERNGAIPSCAIGSVKSMISHTIPAAGVAGIIKLVLALYHKILPPTLCDEPNPEFEFEKTPFYVNTETRPWIHGEPQPRRAGVNAFGFGGINAHAILEEYTGRAASEPSPLPVTWDTEVIIVQSESRQGLIQAGERLLRLIAKNPDVQLKDLAYSLNCRLQDTTSYRLAIVAGSAPELKKKIDQALKRLSDPQCQAIKDRSGVFFFENPLGPEGKLAFLFPGEGSQYTNMLSDLCVNFPEVRKCFDLADRVFFENECKTLPSQIVFPPPNASPETVATLERALFSSEFAIPSLYTANYALKCLLDRLEILPQAIVGHSSGETIAILASGITKDLDENDQFQRYLEDFIQVLSMVEEIPAARLLSVGAVNRSVVETFVAESDMEIYITMDNCPNQMVLCGSETDIQNAYSVLAKKGAICSFLPFEHALHTPWYKPISERYINSVKYPKMQPPQIKTYSCATTRPFPQDVDDIRRIAAELWIMPVRFRETIEAMFEDGIRIFVEVGPKENLTNFVEDTLGKRSYIAVSSNLATKSGISQLNFMVGILAAQCVPMRLDYMYAHRDPVLLPVQERAGEHGDETLDDKKKKQKDQAFKLSLNLPLIALDKDTSDISEKNQKHLMTRQTVPEAKPEDPIINLEISKNKKSAKPTSRSVGEQVPILPASGKPATFQLKPSEKTGAFVNARTSVMQGYLEVMENFLGQQEELIGAYINKKRASATQGYMSGKVPLKDLDDQNVAEEQHLQNYHSLKSEKPTSLLNTIKSPQGPFGIVVSSLTTGKKLTASCRIGMEEHIYLHEHTLGAKPSLSDDTLTSLPVVPLTMSAELMAQTASMLIPDKQVIAITDVRGHRWIEIDAEEISEFIISAECIESNGPAVVEVAIKKLSNAQSTSVTNLIDSHVDDNSHIEPGNNIQLMEGRVILDTDYPTPEKFDRQTFNTGQRRGIESEEIYKEMLFHGPTFQALKSIDRAGEQGMEATLAVPAGHRMFRSVRDYNFHTDPVLIDAAGQVVGCWAQKFLDSGFVAFPMGFKALRIYCPFPEDHEPVKCFARIKKVDSRLIYYDLVVIDSNERVLSRIDAWAVFRIYDWSRQFISFLLAPRDHHMSVSWTSPVHQLTESNTFRARLFAEPGEGIWIRVLANLILSRAERDLWMHLQGSELQRQQWLVGRMVAKDAIRQLLKEQHQVEAYPADIEIFSNEHGQPIVSEDLNKKLGCCMSVSIAHSDKVAVALVSSDSTKQQGIGIGIEKIDRGHEILEETIFTESERSLIENFSADKREKQMLQLWCAKKALAKALGRGMMGNPHHLVAQSIDVDSGEISLETTGRLAREFPNDADRPFTVHTGYDDNIAFGVSIV